MKEHTDQEWIRLLKQNDRQATRDLWELLFTYAISLESRFRGLDDPASLVRDAAMEAYKRIRTRGVYQFRFTCPFRGYCRVIVSREALRLVKAQLGRQLDLAPLYDDEAIAEEGISLVDPDAITVRLEPCMDRLTAREREVIDLTYAEGKEPQDIADLLAISRNYVNVIAWRARRKLRRCLKEHGYHKVADFGYV